MRVLPSARKHGLSEADIRHALRNAMRVIPFEYNGDEQLLVIGPTAHGDLLEIIVVPVEDPERVIHADILRAKFYDYL